MTKPLIFSRRRALLSTLVGAGGVGLRALATGLPMSLLLNPRQALAGALCTPSKAQFFVFNTSVKGDPINANVPGCYERAGIYHPLDPSMAATTFTLGGKPVTAAKPWSAVSTSVLSRTSFWHLMTNTPVHSSEPEVLRLNGLIKPSDMLPSLLARHLAGCLGTLQTQPITVGASTPSEGLTAGASALPIIPPMAIKATLLSPSGALTNLQAVRNQTLNAMNDVFKRQATSAQRRFLDSLVTTQAQVQGIHQDLLAALDSITDNEIDSQITAALTLIQMKVSPVIAIHIPFGGDNHHDDKLADEVSETLTGVAAIDSLMTRAAGAGLGDSMSFVSLNVFGRTLGAASVDGRQHNPNHQVSIAIGKPFRAGVFGGVTEVAGDFGALPMSSSTGTGAVDADISARDTLASFGKTVLASVGVDPAVREATIPSGKVVSAGLVDP